MNLAGNLNNKFKMGILALIPLSVVKELCDDVERDKKSFTGKIKSKKRKHERETSSAEKVDNVKRLLVSAAKSKKKEVRESSAQRFIGKRKEPTIRQSDSNKKDLSERGSSESSGESLDESSESDSDSTSGESSNESEIDGNSDRTNDTEGHSQ